MVRDGHAQVWDGQRWSGMVMYRSGTVRDDYVQVRDGHVQVRDRQGWSRTGK